MTPASTQQSSYHRSPAIEDFLHHGAGQNVYPIAPFGGKKLNPSLLFLPVRGMIIAFLAEHGTVLRSRQEAREAWQRCAMYQHNNKPK